MLEIRNAQKSDLAAAARLEARAFPPAEAASEHDLAGRLDVYPSHFWLLERDGQLVSMVNGMVSDSDQLTDDMYSDPCLHNEDGKWQMLFGVCTDPDFTRRGYASILMKEVIKDCINDSRSGIILNCKDEYIPFYEKLGFQLVGPSVSTHGGEKWNTMRLDLNSQI